MRIDWIASTISDNFFYLVRDGDAGLLVDPFDARAALAAVEAHGLRDVRVFTTHGHPDHAGGNGAVKDALGCEVIAADHASTFRVDADTYVRDGDTLTVGETRFELRFAPGHTDGHIVAYTPGHLISGDVFFVGGAGHCKFGGDANELYRTFHERLSDLPDETIFYPGHDYAEKNARFCLSVEPGNAGAAALLSEAQGRTREDGPLLKTLGAERAYNPFFRPTDAGLLARLGALETGAHDPRSAFVAVRALRDVF